MTFGKKGSIWFVCAVFSCLFPEMALAAGVDTVGDAAGFMVDQGGLPGALDLISGMAYVTGAGLGVKSLAQLRDHSESPQQTRLGKPLTTAVTSSVMLGLPSFMDVLSGSFSLDPAAFDSVVGMFSGGGHASAATDIGGAFVALAASIPGLMKIVSVIAMIAGAFLITRATLLMPQVEQGRVEFSKPMWMAISGVGLWSILPMIDMTMNTMGMNGAGHNVLTTMYSRGGSGAEFDAVISGVLAFVQLIGLIAFVRGLLILKAFGDNKEGSMGKAMTHILGGAAAMNISWTVKVLATSVGFAGPICQLSSVLCGG